MTMPPEDLQPELALIERMRRGEEAAFVLLYRRHSDRVYRLALLYAGSAALAADVTQDAFMHFIAHPGQYDPARGALGAWLCGVARNLARKAAGSREDATEPAALADDANPHETQVEPRTPLDTVLRVEAAEQVRRAIGALAPHYRDVLMLCELADLSYAEAAQLCGIDIGTVRSRLSRARAKLAASLAPYAGVKEAVS